MGTVSNLRGFFKPEHDKSFSGRKLKKRGKRKQKKVASFDKIRRKVTLYLKLHEFSTPVGICFCIHKETGWNMPGEESEYRSFITKYYRKIRNKRVPRLPKKDEEFHKSQKWRELRFVALRMAEGACGMCGARASDGVRLHVDHIKPRSKYPELALDLDNLQILCEDCNMGKSNYDDTDYRSW